MRVSHTKYAPDGVSNYTVMLILVCLRNMSYILKCAEVQDYTLRKKIGKDLSACTVGVIGTGQIGTSVILSPHTAFYTDTDVENMLRYNFESLYLFENGKENPLEIKLPE